MTIANGGHNLPLLCLGDGSYSMIELPKGVVLGAMPDIQYGTRSLKLSRGDTVFSTPTVLTKRWTARTGSTGWTV